MSRAKSVNSELQVFLRRLSNLSGNSPMLFLKRLSEANHFDLNRLSFLGKQYTHGILTNLIHELPATLCPIADARIADVASFSNQIKLLQRKDDFLFDESGSRDLHVGWPFVRGKLNDGTRINCPLLLFPTEIERQGNNWRISCRNSAGISFNRTFLMALAHYNATPVPNELLEVDFSSVGRDSTVFKTAIYELLLKHCPEIHFNADNYRDELVDFRPQTGQEFDEAFAIGQLKLFPNAVLGIFPQADSFLEPDYKNLIDQSEFKTIEEFFLAKIPTTKNLSNDKARKAVPEDKIFTVFESDPFQHHALKCLKGGQSIVVQGPPGTGKSQLLANIIADGLATGKRILMVCQKRAALDVVWQRLHAAGFSDFVSLVHHFQHDQKHVFANLASQVNRLPDFKNALASLDSIQVERAFLQACNRIEIVTEELEQFRTALFNTDDCGLSAKELYLNSDPSSEPSINLRAEFAQFQFHDLSIQAKIKSLGSYLTTLEGAENPWRHRKPFVKLPPSALPQIKDYIYAIPVWMRALVNAMETRFSIRPDFQQLVLFSESLHDLKVLQSVLQNPRVYQHMRSMYVEKPGEVEPLWLQNQQHLIEQILKTDIEGSIPVQQLGVFQQALRQAVSSKSNIFRWIQWSLFNENKYLVKRALIANGLSDRQGLKDLEARLDNRLNLEHNLTKLRNTAWLKDIPNELNQVNFTTWFDEVVLASRCNALCDGVRNLKVYLNAPLLDQEDYLKGIQFLIQELEGFQQLNTSWQQFLTFRQIEELGSGYVQPEKLVAYITQHFDTMVEYDELLYTLNAVEREVFVKLLEATHFKANGEYLQKIFWNSLALAWLDFLETKYPELRMVSSGKLQQLETDLKAAIESKRALCHQIVLMRAWEVVCANIEYNRLNNAITYRDLLHEVSKKRKLWPLRKVIQSFSDEVFKLMPIWLVSPETAAALFPLESTFDIVMFDEASQCFAERGLPAMFRGKQVVVAGDNQQLKPSDFFQTRWEEDTELPDAQVESLLDLAQRHLPTVTLQAHYRSRSPQLVAFSNKNFYQSKLEVLPARYWMNQTEPVLEYVKLTGRWQNHTNMEEANAIADLVILYNDKHPEKQVGIITFNLPQQMLIMDKVEEKFAATKKPVPTHLFIKNIENVQGDERDVIIFSVGYAPDEKGKLRVMFGSLNVPGGENRLNVAITRAREKIIVVTSVWPHELVVENTNNNGPKLLKQYLQFVLSTWQREEPEQVRTPEHHKEWYLKHKLPLQGTRYTFDLFSNADVALASGNHFNKIILTDDDYYQRSLSVHYHHALLPKLLDDRDWQHKLFFSRNYWRNREQFDLEVRKFLND